MKTFLLGSAAAVVVVVVCAFTFLQLKSVRVLEQIGIPAEVTKDCIYYSLTGGYLNYPNPMKLKQVAGGQRADAVRDIFEFAKSYIQTDEFKKRYLEYRINQKPEPPEKPKSMAEQREEQRAQFAQSIKESETTMKSLPADQKAIFKQSIDMMKQQLKEYDDPNNPMFSKEMEDMQKQMYDASVEEYKGKLIEWEAKFPVEPKPMIRKWLTDCLEATQDVDFGAALKDGEDGKKVFTNPVYEKKSSQWKMCYRAGRDVVQAGRTAAQQWLNELK